MIFDDIENQYNEIDASYSVQEFGAVVKGWKKKAQKYRDIRLINDQAYFVFAFSRLEDHIHTQCSKLIQKRQASTASHRSVSAWHIQDGTPGSRLALKKKIGLLMKSTDPDFSLLVDYYDERNNVAHGKAFSKPIAMPTVFADFVRIYKTLKV